MPRRLRHNCVTLQMLALRRGILLSFTFSVKALAHNHAAIDGQGLPGDIRGCIGCQEADQVGHILRRAERPSGMASRMAART